MRTRVKLARLIGLIFVFLAGAHLGAEEAAKEPKKYELSICAIFKNEAKYLKEWIEYHRLVGVDHFYLYNIGSRDRFMEVLRPYIREGVVTLINWPDYIGQQHEDKPYLWSLGVQVPAYENAVLTRADETKWMVFVDVKEFLVPPLAESLKDVVSLYDTYSGITLQHDYFDASKVDAPSKRKMIIESSVLTSAPKMDIQRSVSKTIFRPDEYHGFTWPPYQFRFDGEGQKTITLRKRDLRINYYVNRNAGEFYFGKVKNKIDVDNRALTEEETTELLSLDYEIEDLDKAIFRFVPLLRTKLGFDTGWEIVNGR